MTIKEKAVNERRFRARRIIYSLTQGVENNGGFIGQIRDAANTIENLCEMLEANQKGEGYNEIDLLESIVKELSMLNKEAEWRYADVKRNAGVITVLNDLLDA